MNHDLLLKISRGFYFWCTMVIVEIFEGNSLGNGLIAIMPKLFANTLVDTLGFGPVLSDWCCNMLLRYSDGQWKNLLYSFNGFITPLGYWLIMFYLYKEMPNLPPFVTFHILVMVKKHCYPPLLCIWMCLYLWHVHYGL